MRLKKFVFLEQNTQLGYGVLISLAVAIAIWLFAAYTWPLVFATPKAVVDAFISKGRQRRFVGPCVGQSVPVCCPALPSRLYVSMPGGVPHGVV